MSFVELSTKFMTFAGLELGLDWKLICDPLTDQVPEAGAKE